MNSRIAIHENHEDGHFARPWVWVMIDAFFLITAFFVCTFRVKSNESVLPQALAKGPTGNPNPTIIEGPTMRVHVRNNAGRVEYEYYSVRGSLDDLKQSLAGARQRAGDVKVRVGYDSSVPFGDVLAVMNACTRVGIKDCGMQPLRIGIP